MRVDAICAEGTRRAEPLEKAYADAADRGDGAEVAKQLEKAVELSDRLIADVRAVGPPPVDRAGFDAYLNGVVAQRDRTRMLVSAMYARDRKRVDELAYEIRDRQAGVRASARKFGFRECGSNS